MTIVQSPILQVSTIEAVAGVKAVSAFFPGVPPNGEVCLPILIKDGTSQTVSDIDIFAKQGPHTGDATLQLRPTWSSASGAVAITVPQVLVGLPGHRNMTGQSLTPLSDLLYLYADVANGIGDINLQIGLETTSDLYGQASGFFPGKPPDGVVAFTMLIPGGASDTLVDAYLFAKQGPYLGDATVEIRSVWNDSGSSKITLTVPQVTMGLPSTVRVTTGACTPAESIVYIYVVTDNGMADFGVAAAYL